MTDKKVIGYVGIHDISSIIETDIKCLDVINLAFGIIKEGVIIWDYNESLPIIEKIRTINPNIKILLSVGGWGADGFSQAAATKENREKFICSAIDLVRKANLDGIDIDWEYPCISVATIESLKEDKVNFTLLLKNLRENFDKFIKRYYMLTIAAGADTYYIRCTQIPEIVQYLDYIQLMTYDLRGGYSIVTGHHTNLYTNQADLYPSSVDYAVKEFSKAGVPKEKIVVGAAFYSRMWKGVKNFQNGFSQMAETVGEYGPDYGELVDNYINKKGYKRFWDDEAKAPYLFNGENFISYDDKESIAWKIRYIKEHNLGGIMYWEYKCETTHTLTQYISENLK